MLAPAEAFRRAQAALAGGRPDEAAELFRHVARSTADDAAALIHLGQIEARSGRAEQARSAWREALVRQPGNLTALAYYADLEGAPGPSPKAAQFYERVRVLLPYHPGTAELLGRIYGRIGQPGKSLRRYEEAARLDGLNPSAHARHGSALHGAGRLAEAIRAFRREATLRPDEAGVWFNLSVVEPALGARAEGLAFLDRCLAIGPADGPALARQAQLRRRLGRPGVEAATRKAQIADPSAARALTGAARTGNASAAGRWWCVSERELEPGILYLRALLTAGRPRQALLILRELSSEVTPPDELLLLAAEVHRRAGSSDAALPKTQYREWLERRAASPDERPDAPTVQQGGAPLFSILLPVFNPEPAHLRQAIRSVFEQSFSDWELCIADDASTDPDISRMLEEAADHPRVKQVLRSENGHISAASNSALDLATGTYIGLLDHDDMLAPEALAEMARALNARPELDLIYSDEDKIDDAGYRYAPHFKPAWDPDLSLVSNYICHFSVIRRRLANEIGGFRLGLEGAQDHDLVQRIAERTAPERIGHIPKILYHWRSATTSTAISTETKPYAIAATGRVIRDTLKRRAVGAAAEFRNGRWRVTRSLPEDARVSVIIPTKNRLTLLRTCIEGLTAQTDYADMEIQIVDNGSDDPATQRYLDRLSHRPNVEVLRDSGPFNFSRLCNRGAREATGDFLCFLNNDIEPAGAVWLEELVAEAARPEVGLVGAKLLYPDRTVQHAGIALAGAHVARHTNLRISETSGGYWGRAMQTQSLSAVTGACMLMRREVFREVDGFDEALAVDFGDIDLCLRVRRAGYRVLWTPHSVLIHHESASRGTVITPEKSQLYDKERAFMVERWGALLEDDPAYNPNLSITPERPAFALPEEPRPLNVIVRTGMPVKTAPDPLD
ncbi:glycosyltransferase [Nisaea acidiphila]|uniref:Glycosyltransferase n=1 Tax=Nisaea acidiphila TaxID=1862145 RepID=A0A9J7AMD4_9PROT|nr:glycosyltransferase [Nisaea acidiphila]UUX48318.1 glycosyltransferase [Nisaea acidiphila]